VSVRNGVWIPRLDARLYARAETITAQTALARKERDKNQKEKRKKGEREIKKKKKKKKERKNKANKQTLQNADRVQFVPGSLLLPFHSCSPLRLPVPRAV